MTSLFKKFKARITPDNPNVTAALNDASEVSTLRVKDNHSNKGTTGSVTINISPVEVSTPSKQRITLGCFMVLAYFNAFLAFVVVLLPLFLGSYLKIEQDDLSVLAVP